MSTTSDRARPLALTCVVVTALGAAYAALGATADIDPSWGFVANAVIHLGELAGVLAVLACGALGASTAGRVGVGVAVLGELVLVVAELVDPVWTDVSEPLFTVAPMLIAVGMITAGVVVLRARHWAGWRRFTPLLVGVVTVVVLIPAMAITGGPPAAGAFWAITVWELGYVLLGAGALVETSVSARHPVAA